MAHKFRRDGDVLYCEHCGDTKKIDEERPCPFSVATLTASDEPIRPAKHARLDPTESQEEQQRAEKENIRNCAAGSISSGSSSSSSSGQTSNGLLTSRRTRTSLNSVVSITTSVSTTLLLAADNAEQQARVAARSARRIGNNQTNKAKDFDGGLYKGNE